VKKGRIEHGGFYAFIVREGRRRRRERKGVLREETTRRLS
jgi:hypothetical protein